MQSPKQVSTAIIVCKNKLLLFHRDNKSDIPNPDFWQLPGGLLEKSESPRQAVERELIEEVSYCPKHLHPIGVKTDHNRSKTYVFFSYIEDEELPKFKIGDTEGQEIGFFTLEEARDMKITPTLRWYLEKFADKMSAVIKSQKIPEAQLFELDKFR